ncbi:MAG: pyruvate dehydrogenase [Dehalococcoidia bacterium]
MATTGEPVTADIQPVRHSVRDRVLWLSTAMVHWANNVRPNPDGSKVGGHQSSSASSVAILSALFFETMNGADRVAIKPHASPVFHAIQYLLGSLPASYLERFRGFGGLQAYPSRTKDPDQVDFSTGSVGLGAPATAFGALVRDYMATHGLPPSSGRFFSHIGDAELDEGSVWEAVAEPALEGLDRCVWIVDLNRQSLDRVVPGIRVERFRKMFDVNGWAVIFAKYGEELTELMDRPGGQALRGRIDDMSNEEYQGLLVVPKADVRERLLSGAGSLRQDISRCIADVDDDELVRRIANLGGHDVGTLARCYGEASKVPGPAVVFAYTVKGWGLQSAADPRNHAALLNNDQFRQIADKMGMPADEPWQKFEKGSAEARYLDAAADRLMRPPSEPEPPLHFNETNLSVPGTSSTQDAFGRMLVELDRTSPESGGRIVTVSPDVATSTNLASWINRASVWSRQELPDYLGFAQRTVKWLNRPAGRHIELGISETNLFLLLGQLGLSEGLSGRRLIPIGTVYDPFIARGLDPLMYGLYQESRFIAVATPSGVSLSSEGGAHQGVITPSLGISLPGITYYEPCFARELEWIMLEAVRRIGRGKGESVLLRLSTRPVDQRLFPPGEGEVGNDDLRQAVLGGCYRYRSAMPGADAVINMFAVGAMIPEALASLDMLAEEGIDANVFIVTSPDLLFRRFSDACRQEAEGVGEGPFDPTGLLSPGEAGLPMVTVIDGHPHAMSFLGAALDCPSVNLGVESFGQSGSRTDVYRHFGIDARGIYAAALGLVDRETVRKR